MNNLGNLLDPNRFKKEENKNSRPINERWEKAQEFGKYVGIETVLVMRLFKMFGEGPVLSIRSWLYDCPYDPKKGGKFVLAIWKLKELRTAKQKD